MVLWCTEDVSTACGVHVRQKRAVHGERLKLYILQGKSVNWHSDNQRAIRIVDIGSPNAELIDNRSFEKK